MSEENKLLELYDLVKSRLERDLKALADISEKDKLTLASLLEETHGLYERYNEQLIMLNMAGTVLRSSSKPGAQAIMRQLKSIDS